MKGVALGDLGFKDFGVRVSCQSVGVGITVA